MMALPQGVSKATGLHVALETLRLSAHNTVAIGDAENDHELLRVAEVGVAVEWASATLEIGRRRRDQRRFCRAWQPTYASSRTRDDCPFQCGPGEDCCWATQEGREFSLAVRGRNILVTGDAKSGKSWVAGLLCEQLICTATVCASSTPKATTAPWKRCRR